MSLQVTQLEELLAVRHSVFVVGGPGTGKSQVNFSTTETTDRIHSATAMTHLPTMGKGCISKF